MAQDTIKCYDSPDDVVNAMVEDFIAFTNEEIARTESAFQVQIYNGNITEANKVMLDAKSKYKQYPVLLTFESPNYKVRLGSFRTRLEAEKKLVEIKKSYPASFVIGLK